MIRRVLRIINPIIIYVALTFTFISCSSSEETQNSALGYKYTVSCRNEVQDCYERCSELCPHGYLVANKVRSRRIDKDNSEYSVIIRCKEKMVQQ